MKLAARMSTLRTSATVAVMNRAKELKRQGVDVVSFAAGEPDFDTPASVKEAAIAALRGGQTHYMPTFGDAETRGAIVRKLEGENGIRGLTPEHIAISAGAKHALYTLCMVLLDGGRPASGSASGAGGGGSAGASEVILPVPTWVSYAPLAELAGARVVEVPTTAASGFRMTPGQLEDAITANSRMLVLNSPSNPCGTMYSEADLRALAAVVARAADTIAPDLMIVTDEIYEKIIFGGVPHFSIGSIDAVAGRTITVNGLSKAYAMTGWRVGYAACPGADGAALMRAMSTLQGQMTTNITSFVYPAIRAALTGCAADVERMRQAFASRAVLAYGLVERMPGVSCVKPSGAFYLFPDVSAHFGKSSRGGKRIASASDFAEAALEEVKVAVVSGEDFGGCGAKHVRISFACGEETIKQGLERLGEFVSGLR